MIKDDNLNALIALAQSGVHSGLADTVDKTVRRHVAALIRPTGPEPMCCDIHAAGWNALNERADEIEEIEEG